MEGCSGRVYFIKYQQGYINIRKKVEKKGETREETRNHRKKEKNCKLCVFGGRSDFIIYRGNLILNGLVLRFETRNFVRRVYSKVAIKIFLHLTELENISITDIHMKKEYKSLIIKNYEITKKKKKNDGVPIVAS